MIITRGGIPAPVLQVNANRAAVILCVPRILPRRDSLVPRYRKLKIARVGLLKADLAPFRGTRTGANPEIAVVIEPIRVLPLTNSLEIDDGFLNDRFFAVRTQIRQRDHGQDRDNRNRYKKLNQRKTLFIFCFSPHYFITRNPAQPPVSRLIFLGTPDRNIVRLDLCIV